MNDPGVVLAAILGAAVVGIGVGFWLSRRTLAGRLGALTRAVSTMGDDPAGTHVDEGGPREVAALASAVNRSADRLDRESQRSRDEQGVRDLILSSMQEGVLLVGDDGRVAFSNGALERHLGRASGLDLDAVPARAAGGRGPRLPDAGADVRGGRDRRPHEMAPRNGGARRRRGARFCVVVRDVTEARRLEAVRRDFVANASHELKTPASSIQATAETIVRAATDDPAVLPRFAEQLEREAIRLSRIVADLLDLSRLETGSDLEELVRLDAIVREEVARHEDAAEEAEVTIELDAAPADVRGSGRDLALLVRNLVDNAVRYTKPGGRVDVEVADGADGRVALRVTDTGVGIPSRDLGRIFERFYRVDRARSRETGGTGLGLAIVRHVAENHGGTVSIESELGRGTCIEVRLPRAGDGEAILPP